MGSVSRASPRTAPLISTASAFPRTPSSLWRPPTPPAWHRGPLLADALARPPPPPQADLPLRVSLEAGRAADASRLRGRVVCGRLAVGDSLLLSPANLTAHVQALNDPETGGTMESAEVGKTVEIVLESDLAAPPGQLASHCTTPPVETDVFRTRLFWAGFRPFKAGDDYVARRCGVEHPVTVQSIDRIVSTPDFAEQDGESAVAGDLVECVLRAPDILALDPFERCPPTGWFALSDDQTMVAAGAIGMEGYADQRGLITVRATNVSRAGAAVSAEARGARNRHRGGVLWLTGLSGAGKSTIAAEAERRLFDKGYQVSVLDGDNLRHGLSADLGFSPEDRAENIRRIDEVGGLFARAGMIAITAFISPYRSDRERARLAYPEGFAQIYVRADLATCEARDPKGALQKSAGRRDSRIHRHLGALRGARIARPGDRYRPRRCRCLGRSPARLHRGGVCAHPGPGPGMKAPMAAMPTAPLRAMRRAEAASMPPSA